MLSLERSLKNQYVFKYKNNKKTAVVNFVCFRNQTVANESSYLCCFIGIIGHRVHKLNCRNIAMKIALNIDHKYISLLPKECFSLICFVEVIFYPFLP